MSMNVIIDNAVIFLFIFALRKEGGEEQRRSIMSDWVKYSVLLFKCSFLCNLSSRHLVEEKENEIDVGGRIAGAGGCWNDSRSQQNCFQRKQHDTKNE